MILPRPRGIMLRATALPTWKTPEMLVCSSRCHLSSGKSSSGARCWMPALLTRMSIGPTSRSMRSTSASTDGDVGDVEDRAVRPVARRGERCDRLLDLAGRARVDHDRRAVLGQALGQRKADAVAEPVTSASRPCQAEQWIGHRFLTRAGCGCGCAGSASAFLRPSRPPENCWSASTPIRMTAPITAKLSELGMPSRLTRFCSTCSRMVPSTTPTIEPSPPRSEQPPSTAAAMA